MSNDAPSMGMNSRHSDVDLAFAFAGSVLSGADGGGLAGWSVGWLLGEGPNNLIGRFVGLARHSTIDLTMNVYTTLTVTDQAAALNTLPVEPPHRIQRHPSFERRFNNRRFRAISSDLQRTNHDSPTCPRFRPHFPSIPVVQNTGSTSGQPG